MRAGSAAAVALAAASFAAAGCGSSDKKSSDKPVSTAAPASSAPASSAPIAKKPVVKVPKAPPPTSLVIRDIKKGSGATADSGEQINVQYVGVSYSNGKQFDASWDRNQPFPFQLGAQAVIAGWDKGIEGMKVGGRRELIIPPGDAYGSQGRPPDIAPGETLIFVIDLVSAP